MNEFYFVLPLAASIKVFFAGTLAYRLWLGRPRNISPPVLTQSLVACETLLPKSASFEKINHTCENLPFICVQLPLFNETGLVEELLASVARLDWPIDYLNVQVLDDSDDPACIGETLSALKKVHRQHPSLDIDLIQRESREGFKAGALNEGMKKCPRAGFFAIFDADFRPEPNFLKRLYSEFQTSTSIACVQAAWSYENASESMLTRLQESLLNIHFHNDHFGRNARGWVVNFNGTAGMWRKSALEALGGWSASSVTEDLLLSYKAELQGMRVHYVDSLTCRSQLPNSVRSFLIQQRRWSRGHAQVLRLMRREVMKKKGWPFLKKFDAVFHLNSYSVSLIVAVALLLAPAWIIERYRWIQSSTPTDIFRILELALWLIVGFLFFALFSRSFENTDHTENTLPSAKQNRASVPTPSRGMLIFLASPYLSVFFLDSFLRGLFDKNRQTSGLVFHRTPKNHAGSATRNALGVNDKITIVVLALALIGLSLFSATHQQWLAAVVFFAQGLCVPMWLFRRGW